MLQKNINTGFLGDSNVDDYLKAFSLIRTKNILDKDYVTTLYRNLIMYFLYRENEHKVKNKNTLKDISKFFQLSDHTTVIKAINKIKDVLHNNNLLHNFPEENVQEDFCKLYYLLNKIFHQKFFKKEIKLSDEERKIFDLYYLQKIKPCSDNNLCNDTFTIGVDAMIIFEKKRDQKELLFFFEMYGKRFSLNEVSIINN